MDCLSCSRTSKPEVDCLEGCLYHEDKPLRAKLRTTAYRKIKELKSILDVLQVNPVCTFEGMKESVPYTEVEGPSFCVYIKFENKLYGLDIQGDTCFAASSLGNRFLGESYFVPARFRDIEKFRKKIEKELTIEKREL